MLQCVILAGGLGKRLGSLTKECPKAMVKIINKPFIHYQLSYLSNQGITNVVICVGHLHEQIEGFVEDGRNWNIKVSYSIENKLLGTAGALRLAADNKLLNDSFFIIYGDSYLPIDYKKVEDFYFKNNKCVMTIFKNNNLLDKSNVLKLDDNHILYDKINHQNNSNYIDYGLMILKRDVIINNTKSNNIYDLSCMLHDLSKNKNLIGFEVYERFFEIGSISGKNDFELFLKNENNIT